MFRSRILALAAAAACLATTLAAKTPVRVMTLNAEWLVATPQESDKAPWKDEEDLNAHFERVAAIIESYSPDILNLCEVTTQQALDWLVALLQEKGLKDYKGYFVETADRGTGQNMCFISRLTPDTVDGKQIAFYYSHEAGSHWRQGFAYKDAAGAETKGDTSVSKDAVYYFTVGGQKLGFLGLHLKANPRDPAANAQRHAQAIVTNRIVREQIVGKGYTPIVIGDLNDTDPDVRASSGDGGDNGAKVLAAIKAYDEKSSDSLLVNGAMLVPRVEDRFTHVWDQNHNGLTDPAEVKAMIDHILVHKDLMPFVKRVTIGHAHESVATDHCPVIVDFEF